MLPNNMRFCFAICILVYTSVPYAQNTAELWSVLGSTDHFAMIRHALAPGLGDPAHFKLGDCSTQRNLSQEGRDQAKQIGLLFNQHGIHRAKVYSSEWCRCIDTAQHMNLGMVNRLPALNSFFQHQERQDSQVLALRKWLDTQTLDQPLVLVTHQVNITAFTGVYPASGEMVVIKRQGHDYQVVGTIETLKP